MLRFPWLMLLLVLGVVWGMQWWAARQQAGEEVSYTEFVQQLESGAFTKVDVTEGGYIATLRDTEDKHVRARRLPEMDETALLEIFRSQGVDVSGVPSSDSNWLPMLLIWMLPLGLLMLFFSRMQQGGGMGGMGGKGGPLSFGRSKAKLYDQSQANPARFSDVAGVDEAKAELLEVVDFLKNPQKYRDLGAHIPKGVLLVGPPGTGKTLLARAVAGEAQVPFFTLSGSDFVEMFVGVGAARVRDLFEQAKKRAPCLVFIDELDAIGKSRGGVGAMGGNDEREQTLNQLLAEMDGFDPRQGVILIAATNRPEVLDPALMRSGRFDRQVLLDRPDVRGREAILQVHARRIPLSDAVDLKVIARRTPGMSGADLANVLNEGALGAARRGAASVEVVDLEESVDRLQLGIKQSGRAMSEDEKRRVAYHEAGHAMVAISLEHTDPVHRVTIIPRSIGALGVTLQLPTEDRYLVTQPELEDQICVMLGGRCAERTACGELSSGAQNDLERATQTARQMVTRFGMSETLGAATYGRSTGARFLDGAISTEERNYSEKSAQAIDAEVARILDEQEARARALMLEKRAALERIVALLLEEETLEHDVLMDLMRGDTAPAA